MKKKTNGDGAFASMNTNAGMPLAKNIKGGSAKGTLKPRWSVPTAQDSTGGGATVDMPSKHHMPSSQEPSPAAARAHAASKHVLPRWGKTKAARGHALLDVPCECAPAAQNNTESGQIQCDGHYESAASVRSTPESGLERPETLAGVAASGQSTPVTDLEVCDIHHLRTRTGRTNAGSRLSSPATPPTSTAPAQTCAASVQITHETHIPPDAVALDLLRVLVKQRHYHLENRRRTTLSAKAYARSVLGWKMGAPDAADIKAAASALADKALAGKPVEAPAVLLTFFETYANALIPINSELKSIERRLKALVHTLPWWSWAEQERGVAELSFAALIAELGNPTNYANPAKIWKRMGLSVGADGKADKNPLFGYSGRRRSVGYLIGDGMIKASHPMRVSVYDVRKAYTETNRPDWNKCRRHRDAHRLMIKAWLLRAWQVFRFGSEVKSEAA